ncbi:hypothetical protein K1719_003867 [Acacia pycnantha]|nr:hypothetical protein K1719_003867 [Acacia pycnantha]
MTDKSMNMILELLCDAFEHAKIPSSFYEAKKTITKLGLDYQKIHACPNNCMLYWGVEDENRQSCKSSTEGSIAQGYIMQEILTFCSRYIDDIETRWNRSGRVDDVPNDAQAKSWVDELFPRVGKPIGASSFFNLTSMERLRAHRHVLTNCPLVECYIQEFRRDVKRKLRRTTRSQAEIDKWVHREFVDWFSKRVDIMTTTDLFPSQNLDHILVDDTVALQLSRPAIDDDIPNFIANHNEDEDLDI